MKTPSRLMRLILLAILLVHSTVAKAGYDPYLGRWLSRDPIGDGEFLREGPNLYRYVANAPVMLTDPDGRVIPLLVAGALALWGMTQHAEAPGPNDPVVHRSPPYAGTCAGILVGGGVLGSLPKVTVAIGGGEATVAASGAAGVHVAWGAGSTWLHAVGARIGWKTMLTVSEGAEAFAANAWFRISIPVLSRAAALAAEGQRASSCVSAAASGVAAGWWTPKANVLKQFIP